MTFLSGLKMWHLGLVVLVSTIALGASVGRFEAKTAAQEQRIDHLEKETRGDMQDFKEEVIRHLDALSVQLREADRRLDREEDVLRDLASDVAVLCATTHGSGCSHRQ